MSWVFIDTEQLHDCEPEMLLAVTNIDPGVNCAAQGPTLGKK